jgi:hypothetical protein
VALPIADGSAAAKSNASGSDAGGFRESRNPMDRLARYLDRLAAAGFYGKVTVSFQNGKVHDVRIEQTKKLDEL